MEEEEIIIEADYTAVEQSIMQQSTSVSEGHPIRAIEELSEDTEVLIAEVNSFLAGQNNSSSTGIQQPEESEGSNTANDVYEEEETPIELTSEEQAILDQAIATQNSEIPVNSATLQMQESTSRFSSAIWYEAIQQKTIILAGLGGIGSYVAFLLSRMQPARITMYDDDIVESVNMSGQLYSVGNIGSYKVNAISQMMRDFSNFYNSNAINDKFTESSIGGPIMICGFDNMAARKIFYQCWKEYATASHEPSRCLFIDGRLAAEEFQVIAIQGDDVRAMKLYEDEWLFSDTEAEETLCSYKQTTFMANMIGSIIVNIFVNFVANECDPIFPRDVPFLTTYDATNMYYKVEM